MRALRALWLAQGRPEEGLVVRDSSGQPVHPDTYSRRFKALCEEAEVPYPGSVPTVLSGGRRRGGGSRSGRSRATVRLGVVSRL